MQHGLTTSMSVAALSVTTWQSRIRGLGAKSYTFLLSFCRSKCEKLGRLVAFVGIASEVRDKLNVELETFEGWGGEGVGAITCYIPICRVVAIMSGRAGQSTPCNLALWKRSRCSIMRIWSSAPISGPLNLAVAVGPSCATFGVNPVLSYSKFIHPAHASATYSAELRNSSPDRKIAPRGSCGINRMNRI